MPCPRTARQQAKVPSNPDRDELPPGEISGADNGTEMDQASAFSFDLSYCGKPPLPDDLWLRWNTDPILLLILLAIATGGVTALRHSGRRRQLAFAGAWFAAVVLFVSPICALTVALFSARVGHHAMLAMVVAPLFALSLPVAWGKKVPLGAALAISTAVLWFWHVPDFYAAAFTHPALYWAMQISLIASFTLLWLGLLAGGVWSTGLTALLSAIQMGLLGALLVFAPQPLYLPHLATTLAFGLGPLEDQQLAGLIMWVPANLPLLALLLWRLASVTGVSGEVRSE
jgi:putative membrane protein